MFWSKILFCILEVVEKERREKVDGWLNFGFVWQCGCGCFSNSFSCQNACQ
jgi:putative lipase involved disintegration of autophagic bodies